MRPTTADSVTVASAHAHLLAELRGLRDRLPIPQPSWHEYVPMIRVCRDDFARNLELIALRPEALELLAALIEGVPQPAFVRGASVDLDQAFDRLCTLPLPDGRHPFNDEILPTIDAMRLLLVALSRTWTAPHAAGSGIHPTSPQA